MHFSNYLITPDQYSPHPIGTAGNEDWANGEWSLTVKGPNWGEQLYELHDWRSGDIHMETCEWRRHRIRLRFGLPSYRSAPSKSVNSWKTVGTLPTKAAVITQNLQTRRHYENSRAGCPSRIGNQLCFAKLSPRDEHVQFTCRNCYCSTGRHGRSTTSPTNSSTGSLRSETR
jgi:hypothetical protein